MKTQFKPTVEIWVIFALFVPYLLIFIFSGVFLGVFVEMKTGSPGFGAFCAAFWWLGVLAATFFGLSKIEVR